MNKYDKDSFFIDALLFPFVILNSVFCNFYINAKCYFLRFKIMCYKIQGYFLKKQISKCNDTNNIDFYLSELDKYEQSDV